MSKHQSIFMAALLACLLLLPSVSMAADAHAMEMEPAEIQPMADLKEAKRAKLALEKFIRAYEVGNVAQIRGMLDRSMIGYQRFIDGVRKDMAAYKQIRIHFYDTKVLAGPDVTVIRTSWDKRYLSSSDLKPGMQSGKSMFLLHDTATGWKVAALAGDNVVASLGGTLAQGGVMAQITLSPGSVLGTSLPAVGSGPMLGFSISVYDMDLSGSGTLGVQFTSSQGDSEVFTLTESSPGRFTANSLNIEGDPATGVPIANNGVIVIYDAGVAPATVTMRYVDQNPGHFLPPRTLTATLSIL